MTVLVDTPVIVDHLRDDPRATRLLAELFDREERVWAATPTRTEILAGIRRREEAPMRELFELLSWVEIDVEVADAAGRLAQRYRSSHVGIDTTDYLIAAAAESIGARLVTLNLKHFPMFPGLEAAYRSADEFPASVGHARELTDSFLEAHADELKGYRRTKGSLHFTPEAPLPQPL